VRGTSKGRRIRPGLVLLLSERRGEIGQRTARDGISKTTENSPVLKPPRTKNKTPETGKQKMVGAAVGVSAPERDGCRPE